VSASEDKSAIVWSVNTEAKLKLCCHDDVVSGARFVPKTHQVITAGYDGAAILWNETGTPQKRFAGPVVKLYSMDISSDGALLATASADARVTIWDIATGVTKTVLSHPQAVRTVIFDTPEQVITGDYAGVVRIWPIGSDRPAREIVWQRSVIRGIALARDGVTLATGSEDHTSVIGSKSGDVRQRMAGADDHVTSVDFSPVEMQVAVGSKDRNVYIYRVQPDFNALSEAQLHIASASANDQ
jgi:WD40 repeat protein